ncbi:23417_t:CDS:2, partial [Gigaspora margarita]
RKADWDIVESNSISIAWSILSNESTVRLNKKELRKILWGVTNEEKIVYRTEITKGLIQEKVKRQLYNQLQSSKETKKVIDMFVNTAWNGFFTEIWKKCCEEVIDWEKSIGISKKEKRNQKRKSQEIKKEKSSNPSTQENEEMDFVTKSIHGNNVSKEDNRNEVQKMWSDAVVCYIIDLANLNMASVTPIQIYNSEETEETDKNLSEADESDKVEIYEKIPSILSIEWLSATLYLQKEDGVKEDSAKLNRYMLKNYE